MDNLLSWLEGKKTYLTALVAALIAVAQVFGFEIPEWVLTALVGAGLYTVRSAIAKAGG